VKITRIPTRDSGSFNGGMVRTDEGLLMVYRRGTSPETLSSVYLDEQYKVRPDTYTDFDLHNNYDARLFFHGSQLFMSTTYGWLDSQSRFYQRNELWPLIKMDTKIVPAHDHRIFFESIITNGVPAATAAHDKNWSPFSHDGALHFVQRIRPHRVVRVNFNSATATLAHETNWRDQGWGARFGEEFRGNTPPVLLPDGRYLSVFHTVKYQGSASHYFTGFYTFDSRPPFRVLEISARPALTPEDATGTNVQRKDRDVRGIFICGLQVESGVVGLCGGDNDHSVILIRLPLEEVLSGLTPVGQ
jgi:predicted GH43/DUF377 family glycosyl hydrolase